MLQIPDSIIQYSDFLPFFLGTFLITLFLTPFIGRLAFAIGALDKPSGRIGDESNPRINTKITARLGGLGMVIAIGIVLFFSEQLGFSDLFAPEGFNSMGIWIGVLILTIVGIWDDIRGVPAWLQLVAQILAALSVVTAGIQLDTISIGQQFIDLFGNYEFQFIVARPWQFPADLIIILWILAIINFVNWVGGVDGLHGSVVSIALGALMLIAVQRGNLALAALIATHLGAVLGLLPYNYYPSKIFYGFGDTINGFLIAIFAISGGTKFATSFIILGLPIIDALWVAFNRVWRKAEETKNPIAWVAATMKGDSTHLHHRLLDLGYSWKTVVFIESAIMFFFAAGAFYLTGFDFESLSPIAFMSAGGLLVIFAIIGIARRRNKDAAIISGRNQKKEATIEVKIKDNSYNDQEEEKFIY